jgi:hypothetical protein
MIDDFLYVPVDWLLIDDWCSMIFDVDWWLTIQYTLLIINQENKLLLLISYSIIYHESNPSVIHPHRKLYISTLHDQYSIIDSLNRLLLLINLSVIYHQSNQQSSLCTNHQSSINVTNRWSPKIINKHHVSSILSIKSSIINYQDTSNITGWSSVINKHYGILIINSSIIYCQ